MADLSLAELEKGMKEGEKGVSQEQIITEFWSGRNKEYKTDIPNTLAMSVLDQVGDYIQTEFGSANAKSYKNFLNYYRINAISHKRKSRQEVLNALRSYAGSPLENTERRLSEKLLGR